MSRRLKSLMRHRDNLREKKTIVQADVWPLDQAIKETEKEIRKVKRKKKNGN